LTLNDLAKENPQSFAYIRMDNREPKELCEALRSKFGHTVSYETLTIGDYLFSDVCIERKTVGDLLKSLRDGRIWNQLKGAKENYPRPMIILEGALPYSYNKKTAVDEMKVIGGLLGIAMGWGIPIVPSNHLDQTAKIIDAAFRRADRGKVEYLKPVKKKHYTAQEIREDILCTIPGLGRKTAKEILKKYPTIKAVNEATDSQLRKIKGVGPKTTKWIRVALTDVELE